MLFVIISIAVLAYCVFLLMLAKVNSQKLTLEKRLDQIKNEEQTRKTDEVVTKKPRVGMGFLHVPQKMKAEIVNSSIPLQPEEFTLIWVCVTILPAMITFMFGGGVALSLIFILIGIVVPPLMIKTYKKKRIEQFNHQLGNALLVISNSLRAGFSFEQSIASVAKNMPNPISEEFSKTVRELKYGNPLETALVSLAERMESQDMELLNSAVLIQRQVGGNLADIVETISDTIQDRIRIKNSIRTLTAQGRISGMIVGFLPLFLLVIISFMNPTYVSPLFTTPLGNAMLIAAAIMEMVGFFVISKIVNIKY